MESIIKEVKRGIQNGKSLQEIKEILTAKGIVESKAVEAISDYKANEAKYEKQEAKKNFIKEALDKIGYGLTSLQFINVLFSLLGASYLLIGIVNGGRAILSSLSSCFLEIYPPKWIGKRIFGFAGISIGAAFLIMGGAIYYQSMIWFAFAFLVMAGLSVIYGSHYQNISTAIRKSSNLMHKLAKYGLIITAISIFFAAFTLDISYLGYLKIFILAGAAFFISGTIILFMYDTKIEEAKFGALDALKETISFSKFRESSKILNNRPALFLLIAGSITSLAMTIGNSYYGIYIYNNFKDIGFGGFLNVAAVFLIAVFTSLIGEIVTRINVKEYGKVPLLIFGTLLVALMPLSFYYNPNLVTITMGTIFGVIGGAILGFAKGIMTLQLNEIDRKNYFHLSNAFAFFSFLVGVPLLAFFAQIKGLENLFLGLVIILITVVPLYLFMLFKRIDA